MGSTNKYLIAAFLSFFTFLAYGQDKTGFTIVDSLTYRYYLDGNWNKLISTGKRAIDSGIDYKFLRQRLGYAFFIKGDYNAARRHLVKALEYDSHNPFTLEYLYYSYLLSGKESYSGSWKKNIDPGLQKKIGVRGNRLISALDLEYNFKYSGSVLRSNPNYFRIGLYSRPGARISLYQSFSKYIQKVRVLEKGSLNTYLTEQPEYYGILSINAAQKLIIRTGYHYLSTRSGSLSKKGNLFVLSLSPDLYRFALDMNGTALFYNETSVYQVTAEPGYTFPGRSGFYLKSGLSWISENGSVRFVYNPAAGVKVFKNLWLEGNVSAGDMDRYNDYKGLYVYNSYDPLVFRAGGIIQLFIGKKTAIWLNYSYEKKEFFEDRSYNYKQYSYLGGIKWEL